MDCYADRKPYTTKLSLTACNESSFACDTGWYPLYNYILFRCSSVSRFDQLNMFSTNSDSESELQQGLSDS